jgi:hypothetical protein
VVLVYPLSSICQRIPEVPFSLFTLRKDGCGMGPVLQTELFASCVPQSKVVSQLVFRSGNSLNTRGDPQPVPPQNQYAITIIVIGRLRKIAPQLIWYSLITVTSPLRSLLLAPTAVDTLGSSVSTTPYPLSAVLQWLREL